MNSCASCGRENADDAQVQAKLLARRGEIAGALSVIERFERLAMTTQAPLLKGDGALALHLAGDERRAHAAIGRAIEHYEEKGTTAYVAHSRRVDATWTARREDLPGDVSRSLGPR